MAVTCIALPVHCRAGKRCGLSHENGCFGSLCTAVLARCVFRVKVSIRLAAVAPCSGVLFLQLSFTTALDPLGTSRGSARL